MKTQKLFLAVLVIGMLSVSTKAQSVDEILSKHAEAIGGIANWSKVNTMKMEMVMKMQGMEIQINSSQVNCKAMRTDITVMGMTGYNILTNTNGWNYLPFNGQTKPEPVTEDVLKSSQDELCFLDKLLRYKETGDNAEYLGTDDVEGTECLKIKLTDQAGKQSTYYLDSETYLIIKKTVKVTVNGQVVENSVSLGNYQKLEGDIIMSMTSQVNGGEIEIKKVVINPEIDESIFTVAN
jgi:hypothetical protein